MLCKNKPLCCISCTFSVSTPKANSKKHNAGYIITKQSYKVVLF